MELNGKVLSIHLQTKEQYEEGEWGGPVVSVELDGFNTYANGTPSFPNDLTDEELLELLAKDNTKEIVEKLTTAISTPALYKLLEFTSEKEQREATKE